MVLRPDQDRVRLMLKDTITLLCKNGLTFKTKFCIDAVIGVTLDDNDIFLVSMNEIIKSDKAVNDSDGGSSDESNGSEQKRRKRKRIRNKRRSTESAESDAEQIQDQDNRVDSPVPKPDVPAKMTKIEREDDEDEQDDIMFIKQEHSDEQWSHSQTNVDFADFSNINTTADGGGGNFSLSDMNLVPINNDTSASTTVNYGPGPSAIVASPMTPGSTAMSQMNWQAQNQNPSMIGPEVGVESNITRHYEHEVPVRLLHNVDGDNASMMRTISLVTSNGSHLSDILPRPVESLAELYELSSQLENEGFQAKMIASMSRIGGNSYNDHVRRIMNRVGTVPVWSAFSYKGNKGKRPFGELTLCLSIIRACLRNFPLAGELDIERKISDFLKYAPDRPGGPRYKK